MGRRYESGNKPRSAAIGQDTGPGRCASTPTTTAAEAIDSPPHEVLHLRAVLDRTAI